MQCGQVLSIESFTASFLHTGRFLSRTKGWNPKARRGYLNPGDDISGKRQAAEQYNMIPLCF